MAKISGDDDAAGTADLVMAGVQSGSNVKVPANLFELVLASRSAAEAATIDEGRDFIRTAGYASAGDGGAAIYRRADTEPEHAGKFQSADGAWWEIESAANAYSVRQFGAVGDGATDDWPAVERALTMRGRNGTANHGVGVRIFFPSGRYNLSSIGEHGIQIKHLVHLCGEGTGMGGTFVGSELVFPADTAGITINKRQTLNGETEDPSTSGADGSFISNLALTGGRGTADKDGIRLHARATIENCSIRRFPRDGVHIASSTALGDNANNWYVCRVGVNDNGRYGFYTKGTDANAGVGIMINAIRNGRYGICDESFLGNTYIACHTAANGIATVAQNEEGHSSFVSVGGIRYGANPLATEADLVATEPGTNADVWFPLVAGDPNDFCPTWEADQPEGTYFHGGGYRMKENASNSALWGCYAEGGQAGSSFGGHTLVMGGTWGGGFVGRSGRVRADNGNRMTTYGEKAGFLVEGTKIFAGLAGDDNGGDVLSFRHTDDDASSVYRLDRAGADWAFGNNNTTARTALITGENTLLTGGTSGTIPFLMSFPVLGVGQGASIRRQTTGSSAPSSGAWAKGDICWNIAAAAGGTVGWVCTTAGTPGTWKTFGEIAP